MKKTILRGDLIMVYSFLTRRNRGEGTDFSLVTSKTTRGNGLKLQRAVQAGYHKKVLH